MTAVRVHEELRARGFRGLLYDRASGPRAGAATAAGA